MISNNFIFKIYLFFIFYILFLSSYTELLIPFSLTIVLELLMIVLLYLQFTTGKLKINVSHSFIWLIIAFVFFNWLSFFFSGRFSLANHEIFRNLVVFIFVFFLTIVLVDDAKKIFLLFKILIVAGTIKSILLIYSYVIQGGGIIRVIGNQDARLLLILLPISIFFIAKTKGYQKVIYLFSSLILSFTVLLSFSRGAFLCLIILVIFIIYKRGFFTYRRMLFLLILITTISFIIVPSYFWERILTTFEDPTGTGRTYIWSAAIEMIKSNPLVGIGQGNFRSVYRSYALPGDPWASHNQSFGGGSLNEFLDIAAKIGIPGLLIFLFFIRKLWTKINDVIEYFKKTANYDLLMISILVQYSMIIYFVGSQFGHNTYYVMHIYFGLVIVLLNIRKEQNKLIQQKSLTY